MNALLDKGKFAMLDLLRECEERLSWPWQLMCNIIALLLKQTGGVTGQSA